MPIIQQKDNDDLKHPGDDPNVTDPQENEKDGNVFGRAFDALFGNYKGKQSISANEPDEAPEEEERLRSKDTEPTMRDVEREERDLLKDKENSF